MIRHTPIFKLTVNDHMMIAHSLRKEFFGPAQKLHGATLAIEASFERHGLNEYGVVMDNSQAVELLSNALDSLRHANLDEHPDFVEKISTTEVIIHYIALRLADTLPADHKLSAIEVRATEHPQARATVRLDLDTV